MEDVEILDEEIEKTLQLLKDAESFFQENVGQRLKALLESEYFSLNEREVFDRYFLKGENLDDIALDSDLTLRECSRARQTIRAKLVKIVGLQKSAYSFELSDMDDARIRNLHAGMLLDCLRVFPKIREIKS